MRSLSGNGISIPLILSYIFDWVIIIAIAVVGFLFSLATPNHHPFSIVDPTISYPYVAKEKVSTATLFLVAFVAPAIIIPLVCLIFVPGPTVSRTTPKTLIWRRKLWEWNTGWMGLGLALASTFMITDGMKIIFGKPRPDLLARCMPDLANVAKWTVGGFGNPLDGGVLVSWGICTTTDLEVLNDGFESYPSGHASFSWAGLTYLTLFLCSKFAITIPYLLPGNYSAVAFPEKGTTPSPAVPRASNGTSSTNGTNGTNGANGIKETPLLSRNHTHLQPLRSLAASPPTYLLVLMFLPIGAATYIASTRYSDFRHHGFDILFGALLGFILAWASFRWFHAPIRTGAGWSWGPRSAERAWAAGVGVGGYTGQQHGSKRGDEEEGLGASVDESLRAEHV